ncbi:hypothetical protein EOD41_08950 [Mucilaginibacter limnophilus]|uniref:Uncharacterized protein n=1 Tax=Mucilaginibacter limnophilus TaxID=1932778 RepID=A0A437MWT3_9SPHI|nr:hypothetical protein [Mucilaginibacter limnophilus]RVU02066.1 hypothetical protein EOD41_08950 [Mucilaginibacter limnophilus]
MIINDKPGFQTLKSARIGAYGLFFGLFRSVFTFKTIIMIALIISLAALNIILMTARKYAPQHYQ